MTLCVSKHHRAHTGMLAWTLALIPLLPSAGCDGEASRAADVTEQGKAPAPLASPERPPSSQRADVGPPPEALERLGTDKGDLAAMIAARRVRVLVPLARPFFFLDQGKQRGITAEMFREYGAFVEKRSGLKRGDLEVLFVPCKLDAAIPWLRQGYGDVVASALTVTPEREKEIAFTRPLVEGVREIVVTNEGAPPLSSLADLAGRAVWVTASSSYGEHLRGLNADFRERGLAPIEVVEAPATLSTEDLFEMVHAGIVEVVVADDYKAELWAEVLPGLRPRPELAVHEGGAIAWGVRKENKQLLESLNAFVKTARKGTLLGNVLIRRYFEGTKWVKNPNDSEHRARIARYAKLVRELADEYGFDWLRIAAQCFQESKLDPNARSSAGAVGLMQLLPSTAKDMGCSDPLDPEENLRAGIRYLAWLRSNFFDDPELAEVDRTDFILAAYNAGPGNLRKWRAAAAERGLDANRWRDNVEHLALEQVGVEPVRYVDNIEKYYVAYKLAFELNRERVEAGASATEGRRDPGARPAAGGVPR